VAPDQDMVVVPTIKRIERPPPPKQPDPVPVHRPLERTPVAVPDPPVMPVDSRGSPMDEYVAPTQDTAPTTFDAVAVASDFVQITADVAPNPPYPAQAIQRRLAGEVVLRIRVDASGAPVEVTIETSSGSSLLDAAAAKFVKARWHFVPALQDGRPVEALALLPINFSLPR